MRGHYNLSNITLYWHANFLGIIGLGFNELFMYVLTDQMHLWYIYSKIISTIIVFIWNFGARKVFVF